MARRLGGERVGVGQPAHGRVRGQRRLVLPGGGDDRLRVGHRARQRLVHEDRQPLPEEGHGVRAVRAAVPVGDDDRVDQAEQVAGCVDQPLDPAPGAQQFVALRGAAAERHDPGVTAERPDVEVLDDVVDVAVVRPDDADAHVPLLSPASRRFPMLPDASRCSPPGRVFRLPPSAVSGAGGDPADRRGRGVGAGQPDVGLGRRPGADAHTRDRVARQGRVGRGDDDGGRGEHAVREADRDLGGSVGGARGDDDRPSERDHRPADGRPVHVVVAARGGAGACVVLEDDGLPLRGGQGDFAGGGVAVDGQPVRGDQAAARGSGDVAGAVVLRDDGPVDVPAGEGVAERRTHDLVAGEQARGCSVEPDRGGDLRVHPVVLDGDRLDGVLRARGALADLDAVVRRGLDLDDLVVRDAADQACREVDAVGGRPVDLVAVDVDVGPAAAADPAVRGDGVDADAAAAGVLDDVVADDQPGTGHARSQSRVDAVALRALDEVALDDRLGPGVGVDRRVQDRVGDVVEYADTAVRRRPLRVAVHQPPPRTGLPRYRRGTRVAALDGDVVARVRVARLGAAVDLDRAAREGAAALLVALEPAVLDPHVLDALDVDRVVGGDVADGDVTEDVVAAVVDREALGRGGLPVPGAAGHGDVLMVFVAVVAAVAAVARVVHQRRRLAVAHEHVRAVGDDRGAGEDGQRARQLVPEPAGDEHDPAVRVACGVQRALDRGGVVVRPVADRPIVEGVEQPGLGAGRGGGALLAQSAEHPDPGGGGEPAPPQHAAPAQPFLLPAPGRDVALRVVLTTNHSVLLPLPSLVAAQHTTDADVPGGLVHPHHLPSLPAPRPTPVGAKPPPPGPGRPGSTRPRSGLRVGSCAATRGTGCVSMDRITTWSCRTWLCLPSRPVGGDDLPAALPGGHDGEGGEADQQRQPGAVDELGHVGGDEEQVDGEQDGRPRRQQPHRCAPLGAGDVEEQQRGDGDRAGDRHAEGEGEGGRAAEGEDQGQDRGHQQPVDPRDVDLPDGGPRGVGDPQPRQVAELGGLRGDRVRPSDHRLGRDHGGGRGQHDHRQPPVVRHEQQPHFEVGDAVPAVQQGVADQVLLVGGAAGLAVGVGQLPLQDLHPVGRGDAGLHGAAVNRLAARNTVAGRNGRRSTGKATPPPLGQHPAPQPPPSGP
ncbi:hypothetical protein SBRY_50185 [Actinacidiphila bryophytorum]|uniref:Uncharacterized protein n=1 Tax=Actinacidiphila bryophytorum TaxID=1436133 RepID=A0A9W4MEC7_9ACTN|nr:hypothetical protein SBRY_50185 [Actinacidiphila bryophytorum]